MYIRFPGGEVEQEVGYTVRSSGERSVGIYKAFKALKLNERVRVEKD